MSGEVPVRDLVGANVGERLVTGNDGVAERGEARVLHATPRERRRHHHYIVSTRNKRVVRLRVKASVRVLVR